MARYEFIDAEKATCTTDGTRRYSVAQMCRWLAVSTSGYYEWLTRPASAAARRRERLAPLVLKAFTDADGRYGYRRVHAQLARWGQHCHPELVRDLMRDLGLVACQPRRSRRGTTRQAARRADIPDLIRRDFTATEPGRSSSETSPTCPPGRAGSSSPWSSTATPGRSSGGRWPTITRRR